MSAIVLIVEDDLDIRETLCAVLTGRGYQVVAARHGQDALDLTRASGTRPAIVLLDLQMPVMDGETFLGVQGSEPLLAGVPVVIMTAQLRETYPMSSTVRAVLRKPVSLADILDALRKESIPRLVTLANGTGNLPPVVEAIPDDAPAEHTPESTELPSDDDPVTSPAR